MRYATGAGSWELGAMRHALMVLSEVNSDE